MHRIRAICAAAAIALPLASARSVEAQMAVHPEAGLFAYIGHPDLPNFAAANTAALSQDFIDGAAIPVQWREIEPAPGVYDFSTLDRWVTQAVQLHKKLAVGVIAGDFAPSWLYGPGYAVPKTTFVFNRSGSDTNPACDPNFIEPNVWDPGYLLEYHKMIAAVASHLKGLQVSGMPVGSAYQALVIIKLSGINVTTEELRLDDSGPGGACNQSDAAALWAQSGFTPARIQSAIGDLAASTLSAFPDKLMSVAIIHRNAFPPIDNQGQIYANVPVPDPLTVAILQAGVPALQSRLLVQWDALYQGPTESMVIASGQAGARIGWQMNGFAGKVGSGCVYKPFVIAPCRTVADFQAILDTGLDSGAFYIEVQVASANTPQWSPAFEEAHARLLPFLTR